jgi:hypothetical protein
VRLARTGFKSTLGTDDRTIEIAARHPVLDTQLVVGIDPEIVQTTEHQVSGFPRGCAIAIRENDVVVSRSTALQAHRNVGSDLKDAALSFT